MNILIPHLEKKKNPISCVEIVRDNNNFILTINENTLDILIHTRGKIEKRTQDINKEQIQQYIETGKIIIQIKNTTKEILLKPEEIERLKLLLKNKNKIQKLSISNKKPKENYNKIDIKKDPTSETTNDTPKQVIEEPEIIIDNPIKNSTPETTNNIPEQITEEIKPEINKPKQETEKDYNKIGTEENPPIQIVEKPELIVDNPTSETANGVLKQVIEETKIEINNSEPKPENPTPKPIDNTPKPVNPKLKPEDLTSNKEKIKKMLKSFNTPEQIEIKLFQNNGTSYLRIQDQPLTLSDFLNFISDLDEYLQDTTIPIESTKYSIKNEEITFANKNKLSANKQELISALLFYDSHEDQFKPIVNLATEEKIESIVDY